MAEEDGVDPVLNEESLVDLDRLEKELNDIYVYRDYFFENHPMEMARDKNKLIDDKMNALIEKLDEINEGELPPLERCRFLLLKGKAYNLNTQYDARATLYLSKAIKLNPKLVDAWNELGECYWKNRNIGDAKHSFEGGLKFERSKVALRCLSIIRRQELIQNTGEANLAVLQSVDFAKEAVSLDIKDGTSWCVLGNAYMCQFFLVSQEPNTLKSCMSAYRQAELDPVARGQPDLYYNKAMAAKYDENYGESLVDFVRACDLDPYWDIVHEEKNKLIAYVNSVRELIRTKGKIKNKKLLLMVKSLDNKLLGPYAPPESGQDAARISKAKLKKCLIDELKVGVNEGKIVLGRVIGSIYTENVVPFTFGMIDSSNECISVTVYNWADGRGVIIGDAVAIPEPMLRQHKFTFNDTEFEFKSIRVNNPTIMIVNGKQVDPSQFAGTRVTSSYDIAH